MSESTKDRQVGMVTMKNRVALSLLGLLLLMSMLVMAGTAQAQHATPSPTASPSPETHGGVDIWGNYDVISSVEVGVRGLKVSGDTNRYRSDLNYDPGIRVFDSSVLIRAREGHHGGLFDQFLVTSTGFGGDPSGYLRVNAEKHGVYRFDMNARRVKYFNDLRTVAMEQHNWNTTHKFADFDLTLFPENRHFKLNLGYAPDYESGIRYTTYDFARDEFPIASNYRVHANNFRIGFDAHVGGIDLSFLQGFRRFHDNSNFFIRNANPGNNATANGFLSTFSRDFPTKGSHDFTRFSAHTLIGKKLDLTGRLVYLNSRSNFTMLEVITGNNFVGPTVPGVATAQQPYASPNTINLFNSSAVGSAKRLNGMGDLGATWAVTPKFRISDTFRVNDFRISGSDLLTELANLTRPNPIGAQSITTTTFAYRQTKYRQVSNLVEGDYQFSRNFAAHLGYRYASRRVEEALVNSSRFSDVRIPATSSTQPGEEETSHTHGIVAGFFARPLPIWSLWADVDHGTADNVFVRLANYDVTNFRVRTRVQPSRKFTFAASLITRDNTNPAFTEDLQLTPTAPIQNLETRIKSRTFNGTIDWTPNEMFSFSTGYTRMNVTSNAGVIFFLNNVEVTGTSRYFMRDNDFFVNAFVQPSPRFSIFAAYRINDDNGQGSLIPTVLTDIVGSYPTRFTSPEIRLTFKMSNKVEWNFGYQYYSYHETYLVPTDILRNNVNVPATNIVPFPLNVSPQNYHAHLPYVSVRIYLGGRD